MSVTKERQVGQSDVDRRIAELRRIVNLHPTRLNRIEPFAVENPDPEIYIRWVAKANIQKRITQGYEVVPASEYARYKVPKYEAVDDHIERTGCWLMRCPRTLAEARIASHALQAEVNLAGEREQALAEAEKEGVVILDETALKAVERGRGRGRNVITRRPVNIPTQVAALAEGSLSDLAGDLTDA